MNQRSLAGSLCFALLLVAAPQGARSQQAPDPDRPGRDNGEPAPGPSLVVAPPMGPAGLTVEAKGAGFLDNCGVNLFLGSAKGRPLAFAAVTRAGGFSADVTIPAEAPAGATTLIAQGLVAATGYSARSRAGAKTCADPSGDAADAAFMVTPPPPTLIIDTFEGRPGRTVNFQGRGFCAEAGCSTVTIFIDGLVVAEEVPVRADGTISAQGMVPAVSAAGGVRVEALQQGARGEAIRALAELIVTVRPNQRTVPQ